MNEQPPGRMRGRRSPRRFVFRLHGWLGFLLSLLLFTICLSGTFATISYELDWLANPALRAAPEDKPIAWNAIVRNVRERHPQARLAVLHAPEEPGFAAEAILERPDMADPWRVYLNPYSGAIQGEAGWLNFQRFLRNFHMYLFLPGAGKYVVTVFGFVLAGSLLTGLIVYRKWWRGFFTLDRKRGVRIFWGGAHKLAGVWSLWFISLISITSIWYFVEALMFDFSDFRYIEAPRIAPERLAERGPASALADLDEMVAEARRELPSLRVRQIIFPASPRDPLSIQGQTDALLVRDRTNKVNFDPFSGELLSAQRAEELSPAWRWVDTADPLHFGDFGGLAVKLIWFFFGLLLDGMILSGAWLYLRRMNRLALKRPSEKAKAPAIAEADLEAAVSRRAAQHG